MKPRLILNCLWDGVAKLGLKETYTPVLDKLKKDSLWVENVKAALPTMSPTCKTTLRTGVWLREHGAHPYYDPLNNRVIKDWEVFNIPSLNSLFRHAGFYTVDFDYCTVVMQKQENFPNFRADAAFNYWRDGEGFEAASKSFNLVYRWMKENLMEILKSKRVLLSLEFASPDNNSRINGMSGPEYRFAITFADSLTGMIIEFLEEKGLWDDTLFLWSTDHGIVDVKYKLDPMEIVDVLEHRGVHLKYLFNCGRYALLYLKDPTQSEKAIKSIVDEDIPGIHKVGRTSKFMMDRPNGGDVVVFLKEGYDMSLESDLSKPIGTHGGATEYEVNTSFLIHFPKLVEHKVVKREAYQTDFLPTVLDAAGIAHTAKFQGKSLLQN